MNTKVKSKKSFIGVLKSLLGFLIIFLGSSMVAQIIIVIITSIMGIDIYSEDLDNSPVIEIIQLFSFFMFIVGSIIYVKYVEKRTLTSMGIIKKGVTKNYLKGSIIGLVLVSAVIILSLLTDSIHYNGISDKINIFYIVLFLVAYIVQGMGEEVLTRGYLMTALASKTSLIWAVLISSIVFTLPHLPALLMSEVEFGLIGFMNTMLFSIFVSIIFIKGKNIWLISAVHSIWNYILGTVCGINLSGGKNSTSIFTFTTNKSHGLINGGSYGLEAGVFTTLVLVISIVAVVVFMKNKRLA